MAVLAGVMFLSASSAWASPTYGPLNQTVPIPTATPTPTPVPTVTPAPTPTPEPDESADEVGDEEEFEEPIDDDDGDFFGNDDDNADEEGADSGDSEAGEEEEENADAGADADSSSNEDESGNDESESVDDGAGDAGGEGASDSGASSAPESTGLTASVSVLVVNIREQPSLESVVVGTVFQDDELEVLGRSDNDSWWLVCCALGSAQPAWVNPDFLTPDFDADDEGNLLPVISQEADSASPASGSSVQAEESSAELELTMSLNPRYVWQDLPFTLEFVVRNVGTTDVTNVVLRDELLADLTFVTANASSGGGVVKESLENGNTLITASWDALTAGSEHTLAVQLEIDAALGNGNVIDNLSVVGADETSGSTTAGISIGLPPMALPVFK